MSACRRALHRRHSSVSRRDMTRGGCSPSSSSLSLLRLYFKLFCATNSTARPCAARPGQRSPASKNQPGQRRLRLDLWSCSDRLRCSSRGFRYVQPSMSMSRKTRGRPAAAAIARPGWTWCGGWAPNLAEQRSAPNSTTPCYASPATSTWLAREALLLQLLGCRTAQHSAHVRLPAHLPQRPPSSTGTVSDSSDE